MEQIDQKWKWDNPTKIIFGVNSVAEHLKDYVKPNSRVLCTFGGGSIEKNGAKRDVQAALDALHCEVRWEGGIPPNPEYTRLCEIIKVAREYKPDLFLAVGGGSVIDGTKFILAATGLPESEDPWDLVTLFDKINPQPKASLGVVLTLAATGSEWNNTFVISRRSTHDKLFGFYYCSYPAFSLIDPRYTLTLPVRQLSNGLFDAMCHCMDQVLTPQSLPLFDNMFFTVMRELYDLTPIINEKKDSLEYHARLLQAASFALNEVLSLGIKPCNAIHLIAQPLTAQYGIDHGATLSIVAPYVFEAKFNDRYHNFARAAEKVFDVNQGTDEEKARAFISNIRQWIKTLNLPMKVSDWDGANIQPTDIDNITEKIMASVGNQPFGYGGSFTEADVRDILKKVVL